MCFISTPEAMLEPKTQDCDAGVGRSIGAGFQSLKRLIHAQGQVLKGPPARPKCRSR
jgi:hypothetical protein